MFPAILLQVLVMLIIVGLVLWVVSQIPMDPMSKGTDPAITHFSTCSDAPLFRK